MPRIRQLGDDYAIKDLIGEIKAQCARLGYDTQKSLGSAIGLSQPTIGSYLKKPLIIQLGTLQKMVKLLKLDPIIVLKALGYSAKDIRGLKGSTDHDADGAEPR